MKQTIGFFLIMSLLFGCNPTPQSRRTETSGDENVVGMFTPIPEFPPTPLEELAAETIEQSSDPAPIELPRGTIINIPAFSGQSSRRLTLDDSHILFTASAAIFIVTEVVAFQERAARVLTEQRTRDYNRLTLLNEEWRIRLNSERERFRIIHEHDQAELNRLIRLNEVSMERANSFPWETVLLTLGALVVGAAGGVLTGIFIGR